MSTAADATPILPAHIEDTVQAIAKLHAEHYERATPLQRAIDRMTASIGQPASIAIITIIVVAWIAFNLGLMSAGRRPLDEPPFGWLQGVVALAALYVTVIILITQRRDDELAGHRDQLTLELSILAERKTAKLIELMEEARRDNPMMANRIDHEARALAMPADPQAVLDAIKETHQEMIASVDDAALAGDSAVRP